MNGDAIRQVKCSHVTTQSLERDYYVVQTTQTTTVTYLPLQHVCLGRLVPLQDPAKCVGGGCPRMPRCRAYHPFHRRSLLEIMMHRIAVIRPGDTDVDLI